MPLSKKIWFITCVLTHSAIFGQTIPHLDFNYRRDFDRFLEYSKDSESDMYYNKLLYRFQANDTSLTNEEVLALMIGYTDKSTYKPLEDLVKEKEIYNLVNNSNYLIATQVARRFLQTHPVNLLALHQITVAFNSLNLKDSANRYMQKHIKIMDAMIYSGSGKNPDNPIFALNLADGEYFTKNIGFDIVKKNTDWNKKGEFMEIVQATDPKLVTKVLYFNIQHAKNKVDNDKANSDAYNKKLQDSIANAADSQRKIKRKEASINAGNENQNDASSEKNNSDTPSKQHATATEKPAESEDKKQ